MKARLLLIGAAVSAIAAGVAFAAAPPAPPAPPAFEHSRIDANRDGFVTRAEVQAEADRMFARLDANSDGKLDSTDRSQRREMRVIRHESGGGEVTEDVIIEHAPPAPGAEGERREIRKEIRKEIVKDGHRRGRGRDHDGPRHHMRMMGPMGGGLMLFIHSGESDLNGDGALSKEEFTAQQLRFFDAADANRDGKIKFEPPPAPPTPPVAPVAPTPPR